MAKLTSTKVGIDCVVHDPVNDLTEILRTDTGRARLLRGLPGALASGDVFLAYQPKLHLRSGAIDSVEALLRWDHPKLGPIPPPVLIDLVESAREVDRLTIWVVRQVIADQLRLARDGHCPTVYVNLSGTLLADDAFIEALCVLGVTPGQIGFEVTETAIIDQHKVAAGNLKRLLEAGFSLSIDDYGSGLSSLVYLKELPASELKIDMQFISGMATSHRDPLIVRSTIDLAHALGMKVVAEGVESLATLALLRVMGCDYAQGFLICRPVGIPALADFLGRDDHSGLLQSAAFALPPPESFWTRTQREPPVEAQRLTRAG